MANHLEIKFPFSGIDNISDQDRKALELSPDTVFEQKDVEFIYDRCYENELEEDERLLFKAIAGTRLDIMYCESKVYMLVLGLVWRYYELKMAIYQWKHKDIIILFDKPHELRLAHRVIIQFRETLNKFTSYYPVLPEHPPGWTEEHDEASAVHHAHQHSNCTCSTAQDKELMEIAVQIVSNMFLVEDILCKLIDIDKNELVQVNGSIPALSVFNWYQKMTFFMRCFVKTVKIVRKQHIALYKHKAPGRVESRWIRVVELDSVEYMEIDSPQDILERIVQETTWPLLPRDFNGHEIKEYFRSKWKECMDDPKTMVSVEGELVPIAEWKQMNLRGDGKKKKKKKKTKEKR